MDMQDLVKKTEQLIRRQALLTAGDTVLVGFSGGPDSTCLLHVLHELREKFQITLHALYVDHNLRPDETPAEISFCKRNCESLGIELMIKSIDVLSWRRERRMNKQEAARELRYEAFREAAARVNAGKIALAHNADDQAETLLMRIARGAGPAGLSGIPVKRGKVIRPLLEIERREIEAFLSVRKIIPMIDSSNLKQDYFRNMIRMTVMPSLKQANPNLVRTLVHTMAIMQEEERYFEILVTKALMKLISRKSETRLELFLSPMESMDTVLLRRVLKRATSGPAGIRGIGFVHIEEIVRLIKEGKAGSRTMLPRGIRVIREYALLVITSEAPVMISEQTLELPGQAIIAGAGLVVTASIVEDSAESVDGRSYVLLDAGLMKWPLVVRRRKTGDYFYPIGFGRRKKLQDFFVDLKVARDERDSIPVIASGGDIVWIAGYRADDRFKITAKTKKIVRLAIVKGKF